MWKRALLVKIRIFFCGWPALILLDLLKMSWRDTENRRQAFLELAGKPPQNLNHSMRFYFIVDTYGKGLFQRGG